MKPNRPAPSDFFARQSAAHAQTKRLVLWFALAVAGTIGAVYVAALIAFGLLGSRAHAPGAEAGLWQPGVFLSCVLGCGALIGGVSLFKSLALSGGGGAVARSAGGRKVEPDTSDPEERRLLNVVEEMSLASRVPMPEVYILEHESAINAFAAGDSLENAAVAITRGGLRKLTRDELQAVMGHEFSHILNGDMRLNIRLIGWISGLVALTVVARLLMEFGSSASHSYSSDRRRDNGGIGVALLVFGVAVLAIGFIGNLFAQLIQASISRQREHLADASATQFTRNPRALADALRRIGGDAMGSRLATPHASEIAHMCFGQGVASLFATHPPLEERIRLLDPAWDGTFLPPATGLAVETTAAESRAATIPGGIPGLPHLPGIPGGAPVPPLPDAATHAPAAARDLLRSPLGAQAVVILLLMSESPAHHRDQAELVKRDAPRELFDQLKKAWGSLDAVSPRDRLDLVLLAAPALRRLSPPEADRLLALLRALAKTDGEVSIFEVALLRGVDAILHPADDRADDADLARLAPALRTLLESLLVAGETDDASHAEALAAAATAAPGFGRIHETTTATALTVEALEEAFLTLGRATYPLRAQALAAAEAVARHDGLVTDAESDLLRALAAALRCAR